MSDSYGIDESNHRWTQAATECMSLWNEIELPLKVTVEYERKFRVCFPLVAHSANHVTTAVELQARLPLVASGSCRVAFECALAAQWVLFTYKGEDKLVRAAEYQFLTAAREFSEAIGNPPELSEIVNMQAATGEERSWSVQVACSRFSENNLLYGLYRELSQAIHPSYGTIRAHLALDGSDAIDKTGSLSFLSVFAQALGLSAVLAMDALGRMIENPDVRSRVTDIANKGGLPSDLSLSDRWPDLRDPPTGYDQP